jgi:hypothetical protein
MSSSDDFTPVGRYRALTQPEYWFDIDEYRRGDDQMIFAHLRFSSFSASILRKALHDWRVFREYVPAPVFCFGTDDDAKFERFVTLFGFKSLNTDVVWEGKSRRLFLHLKDCSKTCPAVPLPPLQMTPPIPPLS